MGVKKKLASTQRKRVPVSSLMTSFCNQASCHLFTMFRLLIAFKKICIFEEKI